MATVATLSLAPCSKGSGPKAARLEAWTSALEADIYKDGLVVSKRLDLIVGTDARNGQGVHLVAWGKVGAWRWSALVPCTLVVLHHARRTCMGGHNRWTAGAAARWT